MYTGALGAVSNRETWSLGVTVVNADTDDVVDITGASIDVAIREQREGLLPVLTGSLTDGHIVSSAPASGYFEITFQPTDLQNLHAGMYDLGVRIRFASGDYSQLLVGVLPVIDGIVPA